MSITPEEREQIRCGLDDWNHGNDCEAMTLDEPVDADCDCGNPHHRGHAQGCLLWQADFDLSAALQDAEGSAPHNWERDKTSGQWWCATCQLGGGKEDEPAEIGACHGYVGARNTKQLWDSPYVPCPDCGKIIDLTQHEAKHMRQPQDAEGSSG